MSHFLKPNFPLGLFSLRGKYLLEPRRRKKVQADSNPEGIHKSEKILAETLFCLQNWVVGHRKSCQIMSYGQFLGDFFA